MKLKEREEKFLQAIVFNLALLYSQQEKGYIANDIMKEMLENAISIMATSIDKIIKDDPSAAERVDSYLKLFSNGGNPYEAKTTES